MPPRGWGRWLRAGLRALTGSRTAPRRPNILWICADDYAAAVCGAYGDRTVRTPNLDRLAREGIRFDRAFYNCPLSTPSRQAFWTGRYPRAIGVTLSPTPLPAAEVTLPALLRAAGYRVAAFGKTYYYAPRKHEFDVSADHVEYRQWLHAKGRQPLPEGVEVLGPWRPGRDPASVWLNAAGRPYAAVDADMANTYYADRAAAFLRAGTNRPFFLYVSLDATHAPFSFPVEFRGRYDPTSFPVPALGPADDDRIPDVFRGLSVTDKQGIRASYYTAVDYLDRNVGTVLRALDDAGQAGGTFVVFTSDHGYLLGEHGRFEKHCCYEPAVRVALLMRWPGVIAPERSSEALVELLDVFPTILEVCGREISARVHGKSLLPLLRGETTAHRAYVIAEYADNAEAMIRTGRWKLIYSAGGRRRQDGYALGREPVGRSVRLFDLANDPGECTDVAARAAHAGLVRTLIDKLAEHVVGTARDPEQLPQTEDVFAILEQGLQPVEQVRE
jgi:choline-sulfatase